MASEKLKSAGWGAAATAVLAALIVVGSRNLEHFDAALVGYTFATLFAAFGIAYRYAMWLQRPPTRHVLAPRLAGVLLAAPPRAATLWSSPYARGRRVRGEPLHLPARRRCAGSPTG